MKKLLLFIVIVMFLTACGSDLERSERQRARQRTKAQKEKVVTPVKEEPQQVKVYYEPAPVESNDGNSYWFVVVELKDGTQKMNTIVKQNHRYFSMSEAKAEFSKPVFILNFIQVSKETYENQ